MRKSSLRDIAYGVMCYLIFISAQFTLSTFMKKICSQNYLREESVIVSMLLFMFFYKKKNKTNSHEALYQVTIYVREKRLRLNALFDTGNMLREKNSGKLVCIVEKKYLEDVLPEISFEEYHYVPFQSIGQEHGLLMAIDADLLEITKEEKTWKIYGVLLGLYEGTLSGSGKFQMILHGESLKGRTEHEYYLANLFTTKRKDRSA